MVRTRTAKTRRNRKRTVKRRFKKRASRGTLSKMRTLGGYPDKIMVKLPYTFAYNALFDPDGNSGAGDILAAFSGNSYPNVAGLDPALTGVSFMEAPMNFFNYASRYGKCVVSGAKLDITAAYGGTFGEYDLGVPGTWYPPVDGLLMEPPTLCLIAAPYDAGDVNSATAENTGGFIYEGVVAQAQRPIPGSGLTQFVGNWNSIQTANIEDLMSRPNVQLRQLSGPLGSKTIARFTSFQSVKKFTGVKDITDNDSLMFSVPRTSTEAAASVGDDILPRRGFAWMLKGFVRNGATANTAGSGTVWQISGRITYYYTFFGLRPIDQADWTPA